MSAAPLSSAASGQIDITVGYTDPVIGITAWPSTTAAWSVQPPGQDQTGAVLAVRIAMQPGGLVPAGTQPGDAMASAASDIASRFAAAWYQVMQPDMTLSLATSLEQPQDGVPVALAVAIGALRQHVSASYAFANAASTLEAACADPTTTATLADAVARYGIDWLALGQAGEDRTIDSLIEVPTTGLAVPSFAVFAQGGSVADLVPAGLDPAHVLADPDNRVLPLNPGLELVVPSIVKAQPADGLTLAELARRLNLTPASLVAANQGRPALLAAGFVFTAQGIEVEVPPEGEPGADATLADIALAFRDNGVPFDAVMAAVANADQPGMFRSGATLVVDRQIVAADWTLADNGTGLSVETLAAANTATTDLFPAGTPLYLTRTSVTGLDSAELGAAARAYAIEPGELLRHNAGLAPVPPQADGSVGLPIPGLAALPADPALLRIPYRIRAGQTIDTIAALFLSAAPTGSGVTDAQALTEINRAMPGTIAGGRVLDVAGQSLPTEVGDSFETVIARANPPVTIADFALALAADPQALAADALLLCPPARVAGEDAVSPESLALAYGLDATLVLSANAATAGIIVAGITLAPSPLADQPTIVTAAADSINAIIRRFAALGVSVTIGDIVRANHAVAFLAPGALLLLPPTETRIAARFGTSGWTFPAPIFALRCWATLARNPALVDPAFRGGDAAPGPVVRAASAIAAARSTTPEREEEGAVTLDLFAASFEAAIPGLKLASGRVLAGERDTAPTDIWAVSFLAPDGITKVAITPPSLVPGLDGAQPFSFALRPLSNTLVSESGVEIKSLDPATGGWGASQIVDFQGLDLEVWARSFLAGMDLICTAPYAAPAYRVAPGPLGRLLAAKKLLACAVADGLSPILAAQESGGGGIGGAAWSAARACLHQRLLARLGLAYDTTAILLFNAAVTAPAATATARLSGAGKLRQIDETLAARQLALNGDPLSWKVSQLGNAKLTLAPTETGNVCFPLDVTHPARHRLVALDPVYEVNEIEFDVTPIEAGYEASNWLSFVRSFDRFPPTSFSSDLGAPLVPVPLRAYPELPALISQTAQSAEHPATLADAFNWSYVFTYAHQSAAQDQIRLEIEFNRAPNATCLAVQDDSLFRALAQYAAISDTLWQILAGLQDTGASSADTVLATALDTYAGLAERVALLWSGWWGIGSCNADVAAAGRVRPAHVGLVPPSRRANAATRDDAAPHEFYHYLASLESAPIEGTEVYVTLTLKRLAADGDVGWPDLTVIRADGRAVALTGTDTGDAAVRVYTFPRDIVDLVPAFTRISVRYVIPGLPIARYQNANATVSVIRNAHLLGPEGPETCSAFVYGTAPLGFPEPLVPLISVADRLDIGQWTDVAATNPLSTLFDTMFDGDPTGREIALSIRYGYTLVASDPPIETLLPVKLHPRFVYDPATTVASIIAALESWTDQVEPVTAGGVWGFGISLYSQTDGSLDRPLLELKQVVSPLE